MSLPKRPRNKALKPRSTRFALEPRIVFDAALPVVGQDIWDAAHATAADALAKSADRASEDSPVFAPRFAEPDFSAHAALATTAVAPHEIVFVDASVRNLAQYVSSTTTTEVVILKAGQDGVDQIRQAMSGRTDISAIHLISHGSAGQLQLGTSTLNLDTMQGQYADSLRGIGSSLTTDADILIYGCDFGQGESGAKASEQLAALTGADIASSVNLTGHRDAGGDWVLERTTGKIEANVAVDERGQAEFVGTLTVISATTAPVVTAGPNANLSGTTVSPKTTPPGDVVGSKAVYTNVATGTFGAYTGNLDLVGTITAVAANDRDDTVFFTRTGTGNIIPQLQITGNTNGLTLTIHWSLCEQALPPWCPPISLLRWLTLMAHRQQCR